MGEEPENGEEDVGRRWRRSRLRFSCCRCQPTGSRFKLFSFLLHAEEVSVDLRERLFPIA